MLVKQKVYRLELDHDQYERLVEFLEDMDEDEELTDVLDAVLSADEEEVDRLDPSAMESIMIVVEGVNTVAKYPKQMYGVLKDRWTTNNNDGSRVPLLISSLVVSAVQTNTWIRLSDSRNGCARNGSVGWWIAEQASSPGMFKAEFGYWHPKTGFYTMDVNEALAFATQNGWE